MLTIQRTRPKPPDRIFDDLTMPTDAMPLTCRACLHVIQPGMLYRRMVRYGKADQREHMQCPTCTCHKQGL